MESVALQPKPVELHARGNERLKLPFHMEKERETRGLSSVHASKADERKLGEVHASTGVLLRALLIR